MFVLLPALAALSVGNKPTISKEVVDNLCIDTTSVFLVSSQDCPRVDAPTNMKIARITHVGVANYY
jgi:hypothetical protein